MKFNFQSNKIATVFPFAILLIFLRIDLILLNTLPTGGDMGAHIVPTKFFVEELFYNFKISGWSNDWFAGYPAYYFYFPLPPSIVAISVANSSLLNDVFVITQKIVSKSEGMERDLNEYEFEDLINFSPGNSLTLVVRHNDGSIDKINCNHTYNDIQIEWFKNGSALNLIRSQKK